MKSFAKFVQYPAHHLMGGIDAGSCLSKFVDVAVRNRPVGAFLLESEDDMRKRLATAAVVGVVVAP